jgi:hypothetical protein
VNVLASPECSPPRRLRPDLWITPLSLYEHLELSYWVTRFSTVPTDLA